MPAPLSVVGETFVALGTEVPRNLVVLSLMTFKQSFIRCFVSAQITLPHDTFVYQHMFCQFIRVEVTPPTTWMNTYVILDPLVSNFMDS